MQKNEATQKKTYMDTNYSVRVKSNESSIAVISKESFAVTDNKGNVEYVIDTEDKLKYCIYELKNKSTIVALDGTVIDPDTTLAYFMANSNGFVSVYKMNSSVMSFDASKQEAYSGTNQITYIKEVKAMNNTSWTDLPNGEYLLCAVGMPKGYEIESFFEYMPSYYENNNTLKWTKGNSTTSNLKITLITPYRQEYLPQPETPSEAHVQVVPAPAYNNANNIYDPQNPDKANESSDIPIAENAEWIQRHISDVAYRYADYSGLGISEYVNAEFSDQVPTLFNFCVYDKISTNWETTYELSYYYELTKEEYDVLSKNPDIGEDEVFIYQVDTYTQYYLAKFSNANTETESHGLALFKNCITINDDVSLNGPESTKPGGYLPNNSVVANKPIAGAINATWANTRLAIAEKNGRYVGEYHIFIGVVYHRENANDNITLNTTRVATPSSFGMLTIKNRMLLNLD